MKRVDLNMDFSAPVVLDTESIPWLSSYQAGVDRRRLEREFEESGHTTSVVRYHANSIFPKHVHDGGEEFMVLSGTFSDENGDYPTGYYIRNPPGSSHAPFSKEGCTIFVKLCQMAAHGEPQLTVDTKRMPWEEGGHRGYHRQMLFKNEREQVTLERLQPGATTGYQNQAGGAELFVIEGNLLVNGAAHEERSWLRFPSGSSISMASTAGCTVWIKRGHLRKTRK